MDKAKTSSVKMFEDDVLALEEVPIIIRTSQYAQVSSFTFNRKAPDTMTISDWLKARILPCIGDTEVCVIGPNFSNPHGRTTLGYLRSEYTKMLNC